MRVGILLLHCVYVGGPVHTRQVKAEDNLQESVVSPKARTRVPSLASKPLTLLNPLTGPRSISSLSRKRNGAGGVAR